jgi:hypothetical protein
MFRRSWSGVFDRSGGRECIWGMFHFYCDGYVFIVRLNMGFYMVHL